MDWGTLLNVGLQAGGAYLDYKNKEEKQNKLESQWNAYQNAKAAQAALAAGRGGSRGGGGGGGSRNTEAMKQLLTKGYGDYNAMLQPYVDAMTKAMPGMTALYQKGNEGATGFADQVFNPEFMKSALTLEKNPEMLLPEYLKGGAK